MDEQKEGIAVEYAGFWIRLVAYLIDWMVIWIIDAILGSIFWILTFPSSGPPYVHFQSDLADQLTTFG